MPVFPLLADPGAYQPCPRENLAEDHAARLAWLTHFESHFDSIVHAAIDNYGPAIAPQAEACRRDFIATLHALRDHPTLLGHLDVLTIDQLRQDKLIAHGLPDPFEKTKARENQAALRLYPHIVQELDTHPDPRPALLLAVEGLFAGNIFDLGAAATTRLFARQSPDFLAVRDRLDGTRPWLVDHFDDLARRLLHGPRHRQAIFFCDNVGPDLVLGVIPFCRWLARRGTRVLLAANHLPALNDATYTELAGLLPPLAPLDPVLADLLREGRISAVDSGGTCPLLDLRRVSEQLNAAAAATDLVILEGMGRAVESNFDARFSVDALKLAMIKIEFVAQRHGGKLFDTVCRFDPAPTAS